MSAPKYEGVADAYKARVTQLFLALCDGLVAADGDERDVAAAKARYLRGKKFADEALAVILETNA